MTLRVISVSPVFAKLTMQPSRFLTSSLTPFLRLHHPISKSQLIPRFFSNPSFSRSLGSLFTSRLLRPPTFKMSYSSDSEPDPELLELLRQHLQGKTASPTAAETGVLESAEFVYNHAIDVALDMRGCKKAAETIWTQMQQREYSPATWSTHELHPKTKDEETVKFIFAMDILNFSFWSEKSEEERFQVEYRGRRWTGYWSLVAGLQRGLEEGWSPFLLLKFLALLVMKMKCLAIFLWLNDSYVNNKEEPFVDAGVCPQESPSPIPLSGSMKKRLP